MKIRKATLVYMFLCVFLLDGCSWGAPPNEYRGPVKSLTNFEYIYDFKYGETCQDGETIEVCAEQALHRKNLIPQECLKGIEVLRGNGPNNGWAWAIFRCR